ncbi:MAG TPA: alpha/beta fold hydrolase [Longimicrobiaceae bacterium]|nr:alpha/beta fold hydrolase [Longimicrobiaceae bacterium]
MKTFALAALSLAALLCACTPREAAVRPAPAGAAPTAASAAPQTGQHARTLDRPVARRLSARYLLHLPREYGRDPARRWPVILYLHGGSLRGTDVDTVRVWGVPRVAERDPDFPFIVVSPQAAPGTLWTDTELLDALLGEVIATHAVDTARVYLTGHSMGGNGAWYLAYMHPERFAAVVPMSGPANPWWAGRLRGMPVWVFHGAKDAVVPIRESEEMVRALREAGNTGVRYTALPDRDHGLLDLYETHREIYDWLLQHRR